MTAADATAPTWITDNNGNKCSVDYFGSVEAAQKALDSLKNCHDCINCSNCSGCSDCARCSDCSDCSECSYCSDCSNLLREWYAQSFVGDEEIEAKKQEEQT